MPDIGTLKTAPAIQSAVIGLRAAGKSKRKIAEELGIHRKTVDNVLEVMQADAPDYATVLRKLTGKALTRVEEVLPTDTDTSKWLLEHTVFRPEQSTVYQFNGDTTLQAAIGILPSTPSQPSTTITADSTERTGPSGATEAAAKAAGAEVGLPLHPNFSQFSDEQLERELERRRSQRPVLEAEVVG